MLEELRIRDLAIVEDATITFSEGLNVLTGSTGAGKSIILEAASLLSGSKAKKSLIRRGADRLLIEGVFRVPEGSRAIREMLGMEESEGNLSIQREFNASGRNRIRINGAVSTGAVSRVVTAGLIEVSGQHGQQELLDASSHLSYLDQTGGYAEVLRKCRSTISIYREYWTRLRKLRREELENRKNEEYLRFQLKQLDSLGLEAGIVDAISTRVRKLQNIQRYGSALTEASRCLAGEGGALDMAAEAERLIRKIADIDQKWGKISEDLGSSIITIKEAVREIEKDMGFEEDEGEELESLQERLAAIQSATRKFGMSPDELIAEMERITGVLRSLDDGSDAIEEARRDTERALKDLVPVMEELSKERAKAARSLDSAVTEELEELGMKGAIFRTEIAKREIRAFKEECDELDLPDEGWDEVEFLIRTNIGEPLHPLRDIASGGELSRIALVLKKLLVRERQIPTLIFDEIDTGLGADMGATVADKLAELSKRYQVICITHLPQVAAKAHNHIAVRKNVSKGRTRTTASILGDEERKEEIARMLGGGGELRTRLAEELLDGGKSARSSAG